MTLLGKIFTVLIFIMSLVFMSFSVMVFATHQNWKMMAINPPTTDKGGHNDKYPVGLIHQVKYLEEAIDGLRVELETRKDALARERASRRMAISKLQSTNFAQARDLADKTGQLQAKDAMNAELTKLIEVSQKQLTDLTETVADLRVKKRDALADREVQYRLVVSLTETLHQHQGEKKRLEERRDQLVAQNTDMKRVMDSHGLTIHSPIDNRTPPLNGVITLVSTKNQNYVQISIGNDDGLRIGHELIVYRNKSYLGRAVIRKVDTNAAVAEIVIRQGSIRKGDNVTTRFTNQPA